MSDPVRVPLGFWLRVVDQLLDVSMDEVLAAGGVNRRTWQVLSSLERNQPATTEDIDAAMVMSSSPDTPTAQPDLEELARRGWVTSDANHWELSSDGKQHLTDLQDKVSAHRGTMFRDISDQNYRTTVETLARIAHNIDPDGTRTPTFR